MLLEATETFWLWQFLGRLHPLMVHFPIGLLCVAILLELIDWKRKSGAMREAIRLLTWIGAASAIFAVIFGLLLAGQEEASGKSLEIHRWAGIVTMTLSVLATWSLTFQKPQNISFSAFHYSFWSFFHGSLRSYADTWRRLSFKCSAVLSTIKKGRCG